MSVFGAIKLFPIGQPLRNLRDRIRADPLELEIRGAFNPFGFGKVSFLRLFFPLFSLVFLLKSSCRSPNRALSTVSFAVTRT